ncbi:M56 family metallopeptidase [Streptomyces sp. RB6PN25]|uniref:M56 family metallopeptidase n=1 Tax=Streptomyces humicola TaxID=2953240 RepID=A0ABT1PTM5_9ACTN|nr:M56 family metallopeptidase [Streptomyces humicola]MCQ4081029.1 M56 family metallopeptidase [Streptomyces humicola]
MTWAVWAPLLAPLLAVPSARRLADILPPRAAALLLASTATLLALLSAGALAMLTAAGLLRLPLIAGLAHMSAADMRRSTPVVLPIGALAALTLAVAAVALLRTAQRHRRDLLRATDTAERHGGAGDLTVLPDPGADAYALPGLPGRPGRVVVTAGMLRRLDAREREVLLAHERAHLKCRHHVLIILTDLASCLHPALRLLRTPLTFHLERWADESAARAVGDRKLTARAVGRAALAASAAPALPRPAMALAASTGPVPRRVAALLAAEQPRPHWSSRLRTTRPAAAVAALLTACVLASGVCALEAATDLHANIESAQGAVLAHDGHWHVHHDEHFTA